MTNEPEISRSAFSRTVRASTPCPACGSDRVVPIHYGLVPTFEGDDRVLGGCLTFAGQPDVTCRSCEHRWVAGVLA